MHDWALLVSDSDDSDGGFGIDGGLDSGPGDTGGAAPGDTGGSDDAGAGDGSSDGGGDGGDSGGGGDSGC